MWVEPGDDASVVIDFLVGNDPVIPDANSVQVTIRDNAGNPLASWNKTPVAVVSTSTTVTVVGTDNSITAGKLFESRYVLAAFTYNGHPYKVESIYNVYPWVALAATPADARRHTGLSYDEFPDQDIDIRVAYIKLAIQLGTDFTNALTAGNEKQLAANNLVALQAALDMAASFQMRMAIMEQTDNATFQRHNHTDVQKLTDDLAKKLDQQIWVFSSSSATDQSYFVVSTNTDVITGQ